MKKDDVRDYFLEAGPSDEQKERMLAGVLERCEAWGRFAVMSGNPDSDGTCADEGDMNMNVSVKKRFSRVAVIAAVMALTTVSAFAAVPELRDWASDQFGLSTEQEQQLAESGALQNIQATASDENMTLTVRQTLADENGMYIIYDVESADGSDVVMEEDSFHFTVLAETSDVFLYSFEQQVLEDQGSRVTYMAVLTGLENLSGQEVSLTSCGLTVKWTVGDVAELAAYDADLTGTDVWTGANYHVTGYGLSPVCVKLNLEVLGDYAEAGFPDRVVVDVQQADGSVKTMESVSSFGKEEDGLRYQMFLFDEIIDVDAVTGIYVDGAKLG